MPCTIYLASVSVTSTPQTLMDVHGRAMSFIIVPRVQHSLGKPAVCAGLSVFSVGAFFERLQSWATHLVACPWLLLLLPAVAGVPRKDTLGCVWREVQQARRPPTVPVRLQGTRCC